MTTIDGVLSEKEIHNEDIKTHSKICLTNAKSANNVFSQLIYLHCYYEITEVDGVVFNYISGLLHGHDKSYKKRDRTPIQEKNVNTAEHTIQDYIDEVDYEELVKKVNDRKYTLELYRKSSSNYEKLQQYRMIDKDNSPEVSLEILLTAHIMLKMT